MKTLKRTWAEISLDNLEHNYRALRARTPQGCKFLGVIKADAYGHGAVPVSGTLSELGCEYLAVSNLEEAVQLRRGGIRTPILILGYTPPEYADTMVFMDLTQEIHSIDYARALEERLRGTNYILNVHLKLDTGMGRIGFLAYGDHSELPQLAAFSQLTHLRVEGVFTHFSVADSRREDDERYTALQYARFCDTLAELDSYGIRPTLRHCANSAVTILHPEYSLDMVRGGIALYGCAPDVDCEGLLDLRPVMTLRTTIAQIRDVAAGTPISYGRTFTAPRDLRMAVLPIGYADGLSRGLSGKVSFRLRGQDVPVIGRICMDMCMVDITSVSDAKVGDELTLFGYDEDGVRVPVERLAQASGTISYEILCTLSKRIARLYYSGGRQSEILQYIV
ncbi:MAG: alanine racemase [Clostridiales bacterium]|nr:alanine racemase [Clostridiales bacterium]